MRLNSQSVSIRIPQVQEPRISAAILQRSCGDRLDTNLWRHLFRDIDPARSGRGRLLLSKPWQNNYRVFYSAGETII
jgi:hypothetical protein